MSRLWNIVLGGELDNVSAGNSRIKAFYGTSENAVKAQLWSAGQFMISLPSQGKAQDRSQFPRNSTGIERDYIRTNAIITDTYRVRLQRRARQQP